ncbi:ParB/RepB/Spo0J family partition protein [Candidatus Wolfebacteria bacterium]|nr:ParB/RepB/Spo0J family partition protein [Candidatus Wolfebacteria bacterium]
MDTQNNQNPIIKENEDAIQGFAAVPPAVSNIEPAVVDKSFGAAPAHAELLIDKQDKQDLPKEQILPADPVSQNTEEVQKAEKVYESVHRFHNKKFPEAIFHIEVNKIKPNPLQPRRSFDEESLKELASSIREYGIIQPLVVSKIEKETEFGADVEYQLVAGERRLRAAQILGWERVPAIIKKIDTNSERLEMAIVENLQRADLNPVETARAYAKLQDEFSLTQREIGAKLGKSRETIANALRLLSLPTEIQDAVSKNQISESQARLLLTIPDPKEQGIIFKDLLSSNLSVRELRLKIRKVQPQKKEEDKKESPKIIDPEMKNLEGRLMEALGADVKIEKSENGGKIIITFYSPEEIRGIIGKIKTSEENDLAL